MVLAKAAATPATKQTMPQRRKIFATFFMSLDGVVENPAWSFPFWNDEVRAFKDAETKRTGALLLGRTTYEAFAQAWPNSPDEGAPFFNNVRKHVVSTTRTQDIWQNATFIRNDVRRAIQEIQREGGGDLAVHGSITLARWLLKEGLLDELRLLVYPITIGKGQRLFDETTQSTLQLESSRTLSNGVLALVYRPEAKPGKQD